MYVISTMFVRIEWFVRSVLAPFGFYYTKRSDHTESRSVHAHNVMIVTYWHWQNRVCG